MSRNKLIKFVHDYTGMTYAKSRIICKLGHWDEFDILSYIGADSELLKEVIETTEKTVKAINDLSAAIWAVTTIKEMAEDCAASIRAAATDDDHKKELYGLKIKQTFADDFTEHSDVTENAFKEETITASILNPSEVREQFGLEPIDVNDPHTPVFAPYYARAIPNGKLYQNDGGRVTREI